MTRMPRAEYSPQDDHPLSADETGGFSVIGSASDYLPQPTDTQPTYVPIPGVDTGLVSLEPLRKAIDQHHEAATNDTLCEMLGQELLNVMRQDAAEYARVRRSLRLPWEVATVQSDHNDVNVFGGVTIVLVNAKDREIPVSTLRYHNLDGASGGKHLYGSVKVNKFVEPKTPLKPTIRDQVTFSPDKSYDADKGTYKKLIAKESKLAVTAEGDLVIVGYDTKSSLSDRAGETGRAGSIDGTQPLTSGDLFDTRNLTEASVKKLRADWVNALAKQLELDTKAMRDSKSRGKPLEEFDNSVQESKLMKVRVARRLKRRVTGMLVAMAVFSGGGTAYTHDVFSVHDRVSNLLSGEGWSSESPDMVKEYDALQDKCYDLPQSKGNGIAIDKDGVMHVTKNQHSVTYVNPGAYVHVDAGVHVDELLVCGPTAGAYVEASSSVGTVGVFGNGADIELHGSAEHVVYLDENGRRAQANNIKNSVVTSDGQLASFK